MESALPPVIAVVGLSGSGKTTLLVRLIPELRSLGLRVGTLKHHPHPTDVDRPGKDTWQHRRAGAAASVLSTPSAISVVREVDRDHNPTELTRFLADMDIVLAEGFKDAEVPKIEVHRPEIATQPLCLNDPFLLALVARDPIPASSLPRFDPEDASGLARFIARRLGLTA